VKTDDRVTRQRDEVGDDEAKVVRLRDWLGPDDELVPFGPRAHAQAAAGGQSEARADPEPGLEPSAAAGFWDGDASVHTAVPGPGLFDEPGDRSAGQQRSRRLPPFWRPALPLHPLGWGSRGRERLADLVDRISWRWAAAAGVAFVALALFVFVVTSGSSSSGSDHTTARAGIGQSSEATLTGALGEIGTATRATAITGLRTLPPVSAGVRTIGAARKQAGALRARRRPHELAVAVSVPSSSPGESVETPTTASAPTETAPAPTETEPTQSTSTPATTTGGGGGSSGSGSNSGSHKQSAFGTDPGSLGPGSSPNG
jgi:hypothetical protein